MCVFPFLIPCIMNSPKIGSVGPKLSQSLCSKACEQVTLKSFLLIHLHRCRPILVDVSCYQILRLNAFQITCDAHVQALLKFKSLRWLLWKPQGGDNTLEKRWYALACPQLIHLEGSLLTSLFFHLSLRNDNAFHFCVSQTCCYQNIGNTLIYGDERCWINSKLYLLFSTIITS